MCNQQICKKCIDHVHQDGKHEVIGELDWTPGPSPAAPSARRQNRTPKKKETPQKSPKGSSNRVLSSNATPSRVSKRRVGRIASQNVAYYGDEDFEDGVSEDEIVHSGRSRQGNQRQRNETQLEAYAQPTYGHYPEDQQDMTSYYQNGPQLNRSEGYAPGGYAPEDPFIDSPARSRGSQPRPRTIAPGASGRILLGPPPGFHYEEEDDRRYEEEVLAMVSGPHEQSRYAREGVPAMESHPRGQSGHRQQGRHTEENRHAEESRLGEEGGQASQSHPRRDSRYLQGRPREDNRFREEGRYAQEAYPRRDIRSGRQGNPRQVIAPTVNGHPRQQNRTGQAGRQSVPEIWIQTGYFSSDRVYHPPANRSSLEGRHTNDNRSSINGRPANDSRSPVDGHPANDNHSSVEGRLTDDSRSSDMGRPLSARVENQSPVDDHEQHVEPPNRDARIAEIRHDWADTPAIMEMLDEGDLEQAELCIQACIGLQNMPRKQ